MDDDFGNDGFGDDFDDDDAGFGNDGDDFGAVGDNEGFGDDDFDVEAGFAALPDAGADNIPDTPIDATPAAADDDDADAANAAPAAAKRVSLVLLYIHCDFYLPTPRVLTALVWRNSHHPRRVFSPPSWAEVTPVDGNGLFPGSSSSHVLAVLLQPLGGNGLLPCTPCLF